MKVAFLSSEAAPYAKTGGLADVAGALPKYLDAAGADVRLIMPLYREVRDRRLPLRLVLERRDLPWPGGPRPFSVWEHDAGSFKALFIEEDGFFDRDHLYGPPAGDYQDNGERFGFYARAALETLKALGFAPDVLHGHDWQTAAACAFLRFVYGGDPFFGPTRSLFTIHNLGYQGLFDRAVLGTVGLPEWLFNMEDLEFYGNVSFLKAGVLYATAVSTVSPRYAREIQTPEFGCGLDGLLRTRSAVLSGILNGVDYSRWNPETDRLIPAHYGPSDLAGKSVCKARLLEAFGLDGDPGEPVVGMVTRLASQKGLDIVGEALEGIFELGARLVILGTGDKRIQEVLAAAAVKHPDRLGLKIAFNEKLAHTIYAGSDLFLIPSRYEPCGLTQMYSLKYGTIPVVRATGGLDDTIAEFDPAAGTGNGFKFGAAEPAALVGGLSRAVSAWRDRAQREALIRNGFAADFSWGRSAEAYMDLYRRLRSM